MWFQFSAKIQYGTCVSGVHATTAHAVQLTQKTVNICSIFECINQNVSVLADFALNYAITGLQISGGTNKRQSTKWLHRLNTSPNRPVLPILLWPNAHSLDSKLENVWLGRATQHKVRNCCCSGFCKAKQECRHCEDAGGVKATPGKQGNIVYWQAKRQRSTLEWQSMVPGCCGGSYSLLLMTATRTLC